MERSEGESRNDALAKAPGTKLELATTSHTPATSTTTSAESD